MKPLTKSFIKWLLVVTFCLLLGFSLGIFQQGLLKDSLQTITGELQSKNVENTELSKKVAVIETNLITDKQTIKRLTEENTKLNSELGVLTNKLYFYERVVAPELQSDGVQVYSFTIDKSPESDLWEYELVLMQAQKGRHFLTGKFTLNFYFLENEKLKSLSIDALSEDTNSAFKFKYFQTIKGTFSLPSEISVTEAALTLTVPKSRWYKAQQLALRYDWQTLVVKESSNLNEDNELSSDLTVQD